MTISVTNHLNFRGDARAALEFYRSVVGGDLTAFTYADFGDVGDPAEADQIIWGQVAAANGFRVMAYDVPSSLPWDRGVNSFFVSVRGEDAAEVTTLWEKLSEGAVVVVPLAPSAWAPLYGMLTDAFGVTWVVDIIAPYPAS